MSNNSQSVLTPVHGLVLAGGRSQRLGFDKTIIAYRGISQREYIAGLLSEVCPEVHISCRADQSEEMQSAFPILSDRYFGIGPFGAILTAMESNSACAWFIIASDLPLINQQAIKLLISRRDITAIATAFFNEDRGMPEPLAAIWEPAAIHVIRRFQHNENFSPSAVLRSSKVQMVKVLNPNWLLNVNTPADLERVQLLFPTSGD